MHFCVIGIGALC